MDTSPVQSSAKCASDFSIERILSSDNRRRNDTVEVPDWLCCTRYRPPRLPRAVSSGGGRARRSGRHARVPFTAAQAAALEAAYARAPYLAPPALRALAAALQLRDDRFFKEILRARAACYQRSSDTVSDVNDRQPQLLSLGAGGLGLTRVRLPYHRTMRLREALESAHTLAHYDLLRPWLVSVIKIWFQNRRARERREKCGNIAPPIPVTLPATTSTHVSLISSCSWSPSGDIPGHPFNIALGQSDGERTSLYERHEGNMSVSSWSVSTDEDRDEPLDIESIED